MSTRKPAHTEEECPAKYPYVYYDGKKCCKGNSGCNGEQLGIKSACCQGPAGAQGSDFFINCPIYAEDGSKRCSNNSGAESAGMQGWSFFALVVLIGSSALILSVTSFVAYKRRVSRSSRPSDFEHECSSDGGSGSDEAGDAMDRCYAEDLGTREKEHWENRGAADVFPRALFSAKKTLDSIEEENEDSPIVNEKPPCSHGFFSRVRARFSTKKLQDEGKGEKRRRCGIKEDEFVDVLPSDIPTECAAGQSLLDENVPFHSSSGALGTHLGTDEGNTNQMPNATHDTKTRQGPGPIVVLEDEKSNYVTKRARVVNLEGEESHVGKEGDNWWCGAA